MTLEDIKKYNALKIENAGYVVYMIKVNYKCYIGITKNFISRMKGHIYNVNNYNHPLYSAIKKYSLLKSEVYILHACKSLNELKLKEIEEIKLRNTTFPNGYNLTSGGDYHDVVRIYGFKDDISSRYDLTQDILKKHIYYNPNTGSFSRVMYKNKKCGCRDKDINGYLGIRVCGFLFDAHILAYLYMNGKFPTRQLAYRDLNTNNLKWENIVENDGSIKLDRRPLPKKIKYLERKDLVKSSKTGFIGITPGKRNNTYQARVHFNGKRYTIGIFNSIEEAKEARENKIKELEKYYTFAQNL